MSKESENPKAKKKVKYQHMDECYIKLRDQVTNSELYEENLNLLRQIIEVIIWGDQNKMPFTAVSPSLPSTPFDPHSLGVLGQGGCTS
jgi:hypothetical protein